MIMRRILLYALLLALTLFFLMPVYVLVVTSFKSSGEVNIAHMWDLPKKVSFDGFSEALRKLSPNMINSLCLTIFASALSSLLGALNGYALTKWKYKGSKVIFAIILFGMFIPYQSILIPLLKFIKFIHLYNTLPGLILTHTVYGIPIATLIFRNYYVSVPDELIEAAQMDGNRYWGIFFRIILPLAVPGFVVVGIWQFTNIWNEFLFGVSLTMPPNQPVTVALQNLAGSFTVKWNTQMAGAILAALPTALVYLFLGKFFIRGLLAGSVKG
jgi:glucose/mannose transport system permease protein